MRKAASPPRAGTRRSAEQLQPAQRGGERVASSGSGSSLPYSSPSPCWLASRPSGAWMGLAATPGIGLLLAEAMAAARRRQPPGSSSHVVKERAHRRVCSFAVERRRHRICGSRPPPVDSRLYNLLIRGRQSSNGAQFDAVEFI
jgi:hypothetical protein